MMNKTETALIHCAGCKNTIDGCPRCGGPFMSPVSDGTVRLFLDWMDGVFVGTPEAMRDAVKQAMTKAITGEECPYG